MPVIGVWGSSAPVSLAGRIYVLSAFVNRKNVPNCKLT